MTKINEGDKVRIVRKAVEGDGQVTWEGTATLSENGYWIVGGEYFSSAHFAVPTISVEVLKRADELHNGDVFVVTNGNGSEFFRYVIAGFVFDGLGRVGHISEYGRDGIPIERFIIKNGKVVQ